MLSMDISTVINYFNHILSNTAYTSQRHNTIKNTIFCEEANQPQVTEVHLFGIVNKQINPLYKNNFCIIMKRMGNETKKELIIY